MLLRTADAMAVVKGNVDGDELVDEISSSPAIAFPTEVNDVTTVANVVTATVVNVDRVVSRVVDRSVVANVVVDVVVVVVLGRVGANVVVLNVDKMVLMVAVVTFTGVSVGMNGNFGHGFTICGPSILSKT